VRDANPIIYLIPGVGMLSFAKDKATARIAGEFYVNAINVMRGANGVDTYVGLPEQEAFDIEYWLLEEAKLQRMPKPKSLAGRIALVTGGAGGIGQAVARQLLQEGACVMLTDIDAEALESAKAALVKVGGKDSIGTVQANITDENAVASILEAAALRFGGIDLLVSNAGIASAAPLDETTLEVWKRNQDILVTGYFLVSAPRLPDHEAAEAGRQHGLRGQQERPGRIGRRVGLLHRQGGRTAPGALHRARRRRARHPRQRTVNPDAVIRGSRIWDGKWKEERAASNKIDSDDVEEFYRKRSMLKLSVFPEDIAEAVYFFASDKSGKSTGNILNVDAGNAGAFTR
jgi:NAD(P)-dependent dehydrogenase (short-subunit alcohol dehydrogenase family)